MTVSKPRKARGGVGSSARADKRPVRNGGPPLDRAPPDDRRKPVSASFRWPAYINAQLDQAAYAQDKPRVSIILAALQTAGFEVDEEDLKDKRGRGRSEESS